jgi:hypothetical protein
VPTASSNAETANGTSRGCAVVRHVPTGLGVWIAAALQQPLEGIGNDLVRSVLVAHDGDHSDLASQKRATSSIGLGQFSVHTLQNTLRDTRHVPQPRGRGEHQNICSTNLFTQFPPLIAVAHVCLHPGFDVEVDAADDLTRHARVMQLRQQLLGYQLVLDGTGLGFKLLDAVGQPIQPLAQQGCLLRDRVFVRDRHGYRAPHEVSSVRRQ